MLQAACFRSLTLQESVPTGDKHNLLPLHAVPRGWAGRSAIQLPTPPRVPHQGPIGCSPLTSALRRPPLPSARPLASMRHKERLKG